MHDSDFSFTDALAQCGLRYAPRADRTAYISELPLCEILLLMGSKEPPIEGSNRFALFDSTGELLGFGKERLTMEEMSAEYGLRLIEQQ